MRKDQWGESLQKARLEIGGWLRTSIISEGVEGGEGTR